MFWSAALAADSTPRPVSLDEAQKTANDAAGWVETNWSIWLSNGLRMVLIVVIAVVMRSLVRKAITKLIARMNRTTDHLDGTALGGLLVNAERRRQRSEAIGSVLRSVASFVIMGTAALSVLSVLKIDLAPLLASAGVAGVAIGFGARNLVTDFLSGVFMILEDQYGVGDEIDAGVAKGTVVEVGLRVTKLRGTNGEIWYVRNGEVKRIGNLSQGWATAGVDVQIRSDEDLDRVRGVVARVSEEMQKDEPWNERLWEPVEVLGLDAVYLDSVVVRVSAKTMPGVATSVERELRWRIKRALDAEGIRIVGRPPEADLETTQSADPTSGVAAPSALANPTSPQSQATTPIPSGQPLGK
ncbi:mechanosensitive ion channel family protein [Streptomyces sp. UNOC14_S4]|uniref:mechanosensitive ion channel family protein n=1 Tax=Streptomyces sp. UNOC14_S4 TaxID=2872340 RepID=UPI001E5A9242|nr:mechanosensitive ion channel family protein [Streptomyces sp. UNOC14_S4]MCC3767790.1 mechanosensitive ion channel family protein [Streptomyces sp. UNOC14_S4]